MKNISNTDETTSDATSINAAANSLKHSTLNESKSAPLALTQPDVQEPEGASGNTNDHSSAMCTPASKSLKLLSKKLGFVSRFRHFIRPHPFSVLSEQSKSDSPQAAFAQQDNKYDLRFFIIRHAERVDKFFGPSWFTLSFGHQNQYRPYHENFPPSLPPRSNKSIWALDPPITAFGLRRSHKLGQVFKSKDFQPRYVYASPAMRCIFTAVEILKGLELDTKIAIRIEPGLLEFGNARFGMNIFLQAKDWHEYGVNVDLSYQPIRRTLLPLEQEHTYYLRSKSVMNEIIQKHDDSSSEINNILIVAHATSAEVLTWDLVGRKPSNEQLYKLSQSVDYLQLAIIERQQESKSWSFQSTKWV